MCHWKPRQRYQLTSRCLVHARYICQKTAVGFAQRWIYAFQVNRSPFSNARQDKNWIILFVYVSFDSSAFINSSRKKLRPFKQNLIIFSYVYHFTCYFHFTWFTREVIIGRKKFHLFVSGLHVHVYQARKLDRSISRTNDVENSWSWAWLKIVTDILLITSTPDTNEPLITRPGTMGNP